MPELESQQGIRDKKCKVQEEQEEFNKEIEQIQQIQQKVLQLYIAILNHLLQDNKYKNMIISRLAVLGIQDNNRQLDTKDYTLKYSTIIKLV